MKMTATDFDAVIASHVAAHRPDPWYRLKTGPVGHLSTVLRDAVSRAGGEADVNRRLERLEAHSRGFKVAAATLGIPTERVVAIGGCPAGDTPTILVIPHTGPPAACVLALASLFAPRPIAVFSKLVATSRPKENRGSTHRNNIYVIEQNVTAALRAIRFLRRTNGILIWLPDGRLPLVRAPLSIDFLGYRRDVPMTIVEIANRSGARIVNGKITATLEMPFRFLYESTSIAETLGATPESLRTVVTQVEHDVCQAIDQWTIWNFVHQGLYQGTKT